MISYALQQGLLEILKCRCFDDWVVENRVRGGSTTPAHNNSRILKNNLSQVGEKAKMALP
jgi:hypothetical protein